MGKSRADNVGCKLVPPRSRDKIQRDTFLLRREIGLEDLLYFPIVEFLEHILPQLDQTFYLSVVEDRELQGVQAEFIPRANAIRVRESVYEAAVAGFWWARSTLAHELGHYWYHDEQSVRYAKLKPGEKIPPDSDPERQANLFAATLLAPKHLISGMTIQQVARECGVSYRMANRQIQSLERSNAKKTRKKAEKKKRPSLPT